MAYLVINIINNMAYTEIQGAHEHLYIYNSVQFTEKPQKEVVSDLDVEICVLLLQEGILFLIKCSND